MAHKETNYTKDYVWLYAYLMGLDLIQAGAIRSPLKRTHKKKHPAGTEWHNRYTVPRKVLRDARELAMSGFWKFRIGSVAEVPMHRHALLNAMPDDAFRIADTAYRNYSIKAQQ